MKELKITTSEPFRAKVLGYSLTDFNKVVQRNSTLYSVNDNVFLCEYQKDERGHKDNDTFAFVLKVGELYVESDTYSRDFIDRHPDIVDSATEYALCYIDKVHTLVKEKKHVQLLYIRVFDELGLDTAPLWAVREEREKKKRADDEERAKERKQLEQEDAKKEEERLQKVKLQFLNREEIDCDDFLTLCKNDGLDINIRTKGTFNKSVISLNIQGSIRYRYKTGKSKPKLDGCRNAIEQYKAFLNTNS